MIATFVSGCGGAGGTKLQGSQPARGARAGRADCPARARLVVTTRTEISRGVGPVTVGDGAVWVANASAGEVARVRAGSVSRVRLGGAPISLAFAFGKLWVAQRDANRVITIDPQSLRTLSAAGVPVPVSVVAGSLGAWALSLDAGALYELYPGSGKFVNRTYAPVADPVDMLAAGGELWILGAGEHGLSPFNAILGRVVRAGIVRPGVALGGLSSAANTLWVSEPAGHSLLRVDTRTVAVRQLPAPRGIAPATTAVGRCGVWVADAAGRLELVDPETARPITPPLRVGAAIAALAPAQPGGSGQARAVWVTDPLDGTLSLVDVASSG
jgi:hypothetical protein